MKIEAAESLMLSWLRHVRNCRIAQLNWKPSSQWKAAQTDRVESLFVQSRSYFLKQGLDIYGDKQSFSQLIQQAEIDAIGICELDDSQKIIAVDVAFHEGGLNYGPKEKSVERVVKKLIRTLLTLESYFDGAVHEIVFATPKLHPSVGEPLASAMSIVDRFRKDNGLSAECRIVANADFSTEILAPVTKLADSVKDTSELFLRSVQLLAMKIAAPESVTCKSDAVDSTAEQVERIGELVQRTFEALFSNNQLSKGMLRRLCCPSYSKEVFGLSYSVLQRSQDISRKHHVRYYTAVYGDGYRLCSQWYENQRQRFMAWYESLDESTSGVREHS